MLATISPAHSCYDETLATLRYAERLCKVRAHSRAGLASGTGAGAGSQSANNLTSLVAADRDMVFTRNALLEEFEKIHQGLGLNKPGTPASRRLLRETITDPQQRIARMTKLVYNTGYVTYDEDGNEVLVDNGTGGSGDADGAGSGTKSGPRRGGERNSAGSTTGANAGTSTGGTNTGNKAKRGPRMAELLNEGQFVNPVDGSSKALADVTTGDLDELRNSYRSLSSELVELQIDLDSVRTDRDSLMIELKSAQDVLDGLEQAKNEARAQAHGLSRSLKASERELEDMHVLLRRKEEAIQQLLQELSEEKQARNNAETAYHARTKEFLARV